MVQFDPREASRLCYATIARLDRLHCQTAPLHDSR